MWKPANTLVRHPEDLKALATEAPDLFFLHWSDGAYEHFATVGKAAEEGEEDAVWFVPADRRTSALAFFQEMPYESVLRLMEQGDAAGVRQAFLRILLGGEDAGDAGAGLADDADSSSGESGGLRSPAGVVHRCE